MSGAPGPKCELPKKRKSSFYFFISCSPFLFWNLENKDTQFDEVSSLTKCSLAKSANKNKTADRMKVFMLILYNVERYSQQLKAFFGIGNLYAWKILTKDTWFKQKGGGVLLLTQDSTIPLDNHWNQITVYPYKDSIVLQVHSSINAHIHANSWHKE